MKTGPSSCYTPATCSIGPGGRAARGAGQGAATTSQVNSTQWLAAAERDFIKNGPMTGHWLRLPAPSANAAPPRPPHFGHSRGTAGPSAAGAVCVACTASAAAGALRPSAEHAANRTGPLLSRDGSVAHTVPTPFAARVQRGRKREGAAPGCVEPGEAWWSLVKPGGAWRSPDRKGDARAK